MDTTKRWSAALLAGALGALLLAPASATAQLVRKQPGGKSFQGKDCLECHKKFADKYGSAKFAHKAVKERRCEDCHLRHGIVPKLVLKKSGNELCYSCHARGTIG